MKEQDFFFDNYMYVYVLFATVHCTMIKHNLGTYLERTFVLRDTELVT